MVFENVIFYSIVDSFVPIIIFFLPICLSDLRPLRNASHDVVNWSEVIEIERRRKTKHTNTNHFSLRCPFLTQGNQNWHRKIILHWRKKTKQKNSNQLNQCTSVPYILRVPKIEKKKWKGEKVCNWYTDVSQFGMLAKYHLFCTQ